MQNEKIDTIYFSVKGQVVIPRRLRREFGIEEGTRAIVYREDGRIILKPMTEQAYRGVRGSLKGKGALKALMANRRREREL
jgi:AbrB family looped-hinge helix DNA binding protein